jgi:hypothetical protein
MKRYAGNGFHNFQACRKQPYLTSLEKDKLQFIYSASVIYI